MNETLRYLFGAPLPGFHWSDTLFLAISVALAFVGIALVFFKHATHDKLTKQLIAKWYTMILTIGVLGLLWAGLRYQLIRVLSARIIIFAILISAVVWLVMLVRYTLRDHKKKREQYTYELGRRKYM